LALKADLKVDSFNPTASAAGMDPQAMMLPR
jgi:hypothetical protein